MVTIAGCGMGCHMRVDISLYDYVICDAGLALQGENILHFSYQEAKTYLLAHQASMNLLYVVSGSPLFFSAGATLARFIDRKNLTIIPHTSSLEYMSQKMVVAYQDVGVVSLHGRLLWDMASFLVKPYTFVLSDKETYQRLQEGLRFINDIKVTLGYRLGFDDEQITTIDLAQPPTFDVTQPHVFMIERLYDANGSILRDEDFIYQRGMITKQYNRDVSLHHLELRPNLVLWDVGAGSGSCGITAHKRYHVQSIFFEQNSERIAHIKMNFSRHHVINPYMYEGDVLTHIDKVHLLPDRIFIGGGGERVLERVGEFYRRLNDEGIMVIHCVSLHNLMVALASLNHENISYEVTSHVMTQYEGALDLPKESRMLYSIISRKEKR